MVCVIHTEAASRISGSLPDGSDHLIRRLFERAVSNALRLELRSQGLEVAQGRRVSWPIDIASPGIATILSGMQTDIELNQPSSGRSIVIDTKFTAIFTASTYCDQNVKSGYLYRLYT